VFGNTPDRRLAIGAPPMRQIDMHFEIDQARGVLHLVEGHIDGHVGSIDAATAAVLGDKGADARAERRNEDLRRGGATVLAAHAGRHIDDKRMGAEFALEQHIALVVGADCCHFFADSLFRMAAVQKDDQGFGSRLQA